MKKIAAIIFIIASFISCSTDNEQVIPNVPFTGSLYLSDPAYTGKSIFFAERDENFNRLGVYGVVIYKAASDTYYTYDDMCPYEKSSTARVQIEKGKDGYVQCPVCKSEYFLVGGYADVTKGPSHYSLKVYQNKYIFSDNTLVIWN